MGAGRNRRNRARQAEEEEEIVFEEDGNSGDGRLMLFQGGEHLTLDDVLNATGQVMEKTSYGTVYKAKLADGGNITLRLLREGTCKDQAECLPVVRQLARVRHENLVALRAFYQGNRGEKLLVGDYHPNRTLHDLLHAAAELGSPAQDRPGSGTWAGAPPRGAGDAGDARQRAVEERAGGRVLRAAADGVQDRQASGRSSGGRDGVGGEGGRVQGAGLQRMKKCNARTDVYSFGILLLEILLGKKPGKGTGKEGDGADLPAVVKAAVLEEATMEVFDMEVMKGVKSPMEEGLVQALKLAMGCCAPVAAVRPDMSEVVKQLEENRPRNRWGDRAFFPIAAVVGPSNAGAPVEASGGLLVVVGQSNTGALVKVSEW
ncbi:hypothetical protein ZIOFF_071835 [Zingiber officinale]|uniref:Protein kinase domain-containing protein n=1 Tax=Zingiber officinale TaxID=94328 RepID=A0A8J5C4B3_ZINOF|nr:hypothetical protein ZIOFF_071835 [Zingiber officinale]